MNYDDYISGGAALLGIILSWFIGELNGIVKILLAMIVIDYATGVMKGFVLRNWSSEVGAKGIAKKVLILSLVGIANIADRELMGQTEFARDAVCCFYIANEGLSVFENAVQLGVPVPETLKERFLAWKNSAESKEEHNSHKKKGHRVKDDQP